MPEVADLLFELGTEELPPLALKRLSNAFEDEFTTGLEAAALNHGEVTAYAAPRRLALHIKDVPYKQPDRNIERRGPAIQAAFDKDGNATKAAEGFARSCGTSVDQLERQKTDKGEWLCFQFKEEGKSAKELLPAIAEQALNKLPIPKRMRWGDSDAQFVRPVHWLLFLQGDEVIPCTILDAEAGNLTYGHRFHHPGSIEIDNPEAYADKLKDKGYVIAHFGDRREKIEKQVTTTAESLGGIADLDDELLDEVTSLNEWPVPIAGSFEDKFLEVPHEALVLTMKQNQKYFPLFDSNQILMNHFITIANIDSPKPELIKEGNERVVRPRLADAMFFWQQDGKKRLEDHLDSLKSVVFQQKLGTLYEKSQRVASLAECIANQMKEDTELTNRAGLLSRCDLMTEMVQEFPKMQGTMGRYQAIRDNEPGELALAMEEFYLPRYSGDQLPQSPVGIALALAERLDTLVAIFGIGMKPTGDKDPFALRRAAVGALRILREHSLTFNLKDMLLVAEDELRDKLDNTNVVVDVYDFMMERLRVLCLDEGISPDLFHAVANIEPDNLADFDDRLEAVKAFNQLPEAESLASANKRIRNILKKVEGDIPDAIVPDLFEAAEEKQLYDKLVTIEKEIQPLLLKADYSSVLKNLSALRQSVDAFFDEVMVMTEDARLRNNRLALLNHMYQQFLQVADIGELQQ